MSNEQYLLQQIGKHLEFSRRTLSEVEAGLQAIMRALSNIEKMVERSGDSRDVMRGLGEVANRVNALGAALVDTGDRYANVERGFLEIIREMGRG